MTIHRFARLGTAALLASVVAGCVSFGPKPPPTLMTLHNAAPVAAGTTRSADEAHAVAVAVPTVEPTLATPRVMVQAGPNSVAYIKDALWAATPAILLRNLMAETITARTGRVVPDPRLVSVQPDTRLSGHLDAFGLDAAAQAVVVTFDGTILRSGSPTIETRRFMARVPVASDSPQTVGMALDQAANQVATDVADWVGTR